MAKRNRKYDVVRKRISGPGKFEGGGDTVTQKLYDLMLDGAISDELGDVQYADGWRGLILMGDDPIRVKEDDGSITMVKAAILREDNYGFFDATEYGSEREANKDWAEIAAEISGEEVEGFMDYITSERSEVLAEMAKIADDYEKKHGEPLKVDVLIDRWANRLEEGLPDNDDVMNELEEIAKDALSGGGGDDDEDED